MNTVLPLYFTFTLALTVLVDVLHVHMEWQCCTMHVIIIYIYEKKKVTSRTPEPTNQLAVVLLLTIDPNLGRPGYDTSINTGPSRV